MVSLKDIEHNNSLPTGPYRFEYLLAACKLEQQRLLLREEDDDDADDRHYHHAITNVVGHPSTICKNDEPKPVSKVRIVEEKKEMKLKGSVEGNCLKKVRMIGKKSTKPRTTGGNPSPPKLHSLDQSARELNPFLPPKLYSHDQSTLELNPSLPLELHSNDQSALELNPSLLSKLHDQSSCPCRLELNPSPTRKRSKKEGAAENKRKRGGGINIQEPLPPGLAEKLNNLIPHLPNLPNNQEALNAKLAIEKELKETDVSNHHNRMSIPSKHIHQKFLNREEELKLCERNEKNVGSIDVPLITPTMEMVTASLRRWPMNKQSGPPSISYVLTSTWNKIKQQNKLRSGMNVQLWAIRIDGVLCFALTLKPKKKRKIAWYR
ncbi:putative B3 domain-containing protein At3g49610 [Ipomoea triloba]|uniref:putative B3 domain-containing protein At3g49610 n=1 Tax=Ipomoea triloba TaxID=35885 RepID=UPI00125CDB1C|nr:putative B3 domain-containing protein At3g49610 [Ipomoea triloba]